MSEIIALADYRRQVAELYASARASGGTRDGWRTWRAGRDALFRTHSQTPLEPERRSAGYETPFFDHDPDYRIVAEMRPVDDFDIELAHSGEGTTPFQAFGMVDLVLPTGDVSLTVYWLRGYGGGLFLPFRDATAGEQTYGGGRYLLDSVKGADLGSEGGRLVLDFNYAYHPSCVHSPRWSCPLAPPDNHLDVVIPVGERLA